MIHEMTYFWNWISVNIRSVWIKAASALVCVHKTEHFNQILNQNSGSVLN